MEYFAHSPTGLIHLVTAIIALISGTTVLLSMKGTRFHKRWGYAYVISMSLMLITSFMIYMLFNGFGIFHYGAIGSSITLIAGFVPVITRRSRSNWLEWHFSMMYWSVMGLYAAFFAEVFTRVPKAPFFGMVGVTFILTMILGGFFWRTLKVKWTNQFKR